MIIYVKDLLHYMEVHKSHLECSTYTWWKKHNKELFIDTFINWVNSTNFNHKEGIQVYLLYKQRFPRATLELIKLKLGI